MVFLKASLQGARSQAPILISSVEMCLLAGDDNHSIMNVNVITVLQNYFH